MRDILQAACINHNRLNACTIVMFYAQICLLMDIHTEGISCLSHTDLHVHVSQEYIIPHEHTYMHVIHVYTHMHVHIYTQHVLRVHSYV